ncbi:MAG: ABC transporter permease, partial [Flavobacteriaceae bacterium]|nr:ABC transporter permease [Flavobacteriaceae bacterium]
MRTDLFIAQRIQNSKIYKNSVSAPIVKIATAAIAISTLIMIVAIATGLGLQQKIREKVAAFNGHIQISNFDNNKSEVSISSVSKQQGFYPNPENLQGVAHIQAVAAVAGIIRTEDNFEGVILKGVDSNYRWTYLQEFLIEGRLPDYSAALNTEVLISSYLAQRLNFKLGDKLICYFLKDSNSANTRRFDIVGIYDSGFRDFDQKYMIGDIRHIQRIMKWDPDDVGHFEVFVEDFKELEDLNLSIYEQLPIHLNSISLRERFPSIFDWIDLFEVNIFGIIGIMLLIGGFNMITALLVLIFERSYMIGVLKSVGANYKLIRNVFLINALHIVGKGLLWGNL